MNYTCELYMLYICLWVITKKCSNYLDRFMSKKSTNFDLHLLSKPMHVFLSDDRGNFISFNSQKSF